MPLLLHPEPRRVAFVGLATGISASAAPALGVADTTVVELVPEVAAAARAALRAPGTAACSSVPTSRLSSATAAAGWRRRRGTFDVIVADLFMPWQAGAGSLYTREMYAAAARRLAPGGLFCQWLPLYQLTREEFDAHRAHVRGGVPGHARCGAPTSTPIGRSSASSGSWPRVRSIASPRPGASRPLPDWARDSLLAAPRGLWMLSVGSLADAAGLLPGTDLNSDDRPVLEFLAPRLTRVGADGDKDWFTGAPLAEFTEALAALPSHAADPVLGDTEDVDAARRAGRLLYRYALAAARHDADEAARDEAAVRALVPDVVAGEESAAAFGTLADARRALDDLRREQDAARGRLEAMEQQLGELSRDRKEAR